MAESSEAVLENMGEDDFVALVQTCGLDMPQDVLDQLKRRRLLTPAQFDGDEAWTPVHLYLVVLYFDAVTQIRHPWTSISGGMTVNEVSDRVSEVVEFLEDAHADPKSMREQARDLAEEVNALASDKNPMGELGKLLDIESDQTRSLLSGPGRLFAELKILGRSLDAFASDDAADEDGAAPRADARTALGVHAKSEPEPLSDATSAPATPEVDDGADEDARPPESASPDQSRGATSEPEQPPRTRSEEPSTPEPTASKPQRSEAPDSGAAPSEPQVRTATDTPSVEESHSDQDSDAENAFAVNDATEVMDEDELAAMAEDADVAANQSSGDEFRREGSSVTSRTRDLRSRLDNLRHEDKKVALERGKDVDLDEEADAAADESQEMAERIAELNKLREKYLKSQEWKKLTELYEDGISLFVEPTERQQVYMTLAMLYEVKLGELEKALDRFIDAYAEEGGAPESRKKALEGLRRVGRQKVNQSRYLEWLESAVSELDDPSRRAQLQREYALALHAAGEGQRAFYTFTSYLADAPREQLEDETLDDLEMLGESVGDEELTEFYRDFVRDDLPEDVSADVAMRAARHASDSGDNETAVEFYESLLEAQPDHEVAFHSLAHLYEDTERWLELYQLYDRRVAEKDADAGPALTSELERVEEQLLDHADQITYRLEAAFVSGDEGIVDDFARLYVKHERYAEGYAFLNKFVEDADDERARTRAFLALGNIAVRHLHAPEEAALHYERALELGGPSADVLQRLAQVRFDSGDWTDALTVVRALVDQVGDELDRKETITWLTMGIRAADRADRAEERAALVDELADIAPEHELAGGDDD